MRNVLLTLLLVLFQLGSSGTQPTPDSMKIGNKYVDVHGFELSVSLNNRIEEAREKNNVWIQVSSNWDGYYAKLEVREGKLYLKELAIDCNEDGDSAVKKIELESSKGILCDWFTGALREYLPNWRYAKFVRNYLFIDGKYVGTKRENAFGQELRIPGPPGKHTRKFKS